MDTTDVIVVGGGLAGVKTALDLNARGHSVLLLERAQTLGGRAGSHFHVKHGWIDVGQHVYLGCCYEYRKLLDDLGTAHLAPMEKRVDLTLIDGGMATKTDAKEGLTQTFTPLSARLKARSLPYPVSLATAIMQYNHLSLDDKMATFRLMLKAKRDWKLDRSTLRDIRFSRWLEQSGTSANALDALWEPLIVATLNADPQNVSAEAGVMVIVKALLGGKKGANIGIPRVPLSDLLKPATTILAQHPGTDHPCRGVRLRTSVRSVMMDQRHARGVILSDGSRIYAKAIVLATAHPDVLRLIPDHEIRNDPFFSGLQNLTSHPIINVHFWFDRPITDEKMIGFIRSPLQWLFDLSSLFAENTEDNERAKSREVDKKVRHYSMSISDAKEHIERQSRDLIDEMECELRRLLPEARNAQRIDATVRKMRHATFGSAPGAYKFRPGNKTPIKGLYVAGDYTDTGWPSTMESAVISGRMCAELVAKSWQTP